MFGIKFHNSTLSASPKMVDLVNHVMGYLELLNSDHLQSPEVTIKHDVEMLSIDEKSATAKKLQASTAAPDSAGTVQSTEKEGEERKKALRIAKTGNSKFSDSMVVLPYLNILLVLDVPNCFFNDMSFIFLCHIQWGLPFKCLLQ